MNLVAAPRLDTDLTETPRDRDQAPTAQAAPLLPFCSRRLPWPPFFV